MAARLFLLAAVERANVFNQRLDFVFLQLVTETLHHRVFPSVLDGVQEFGVFLGGLPFGIRKIRSLDGGEAFAVRPMAHGTFRPEIVRGTIRWGSLQAPSQDQQTCSHEHKSKTNA